MEYQDEAIMFLENADIDPDVSVDTMHGESTYVRVLMSVFAEKILMKTDFPALKLLEKRLESGCYIRKQDKKWWLFDEDGEGVASGDTLAKMLVSLIFVDC